MKLKSITLNGYKSFKKLAQFKLGNINVLIGKNGVGKSNFLGFFKFCAELAKGNLAIFSTQQGKSEGLFYWGRKQTDSITASIAFEHKHQTITYDIRLSYTNDEQLQFNEENLNIQSPNASDILSALGRGHQESHLGRFEPIDVGKQLLGAMKSWERYHFCDTGDTSPIKTAHELSNNLYLRPDGKNLAAYLAMLHQSFPGDYDRIMGAVQSVAPSFGGIYQRKSPTPYIELEWYDAEDSTAPHHAHLLSDGTLRFLCLATLLLQPTQNLPNCIIIDEPELGLHPQSIDLLAEMVRSAAQSTQIILATHSVELLNTFDPKHVIVAEHSVLEGSSLKRLSEEELAIWLQDDYQVGDLFQHDILSGLLKHE